jgi:hypothetical protein
MFHILLIISLCSVIKKIEKIIIYTSQKKWSYGYTSRMFPIFGPVLLPGRGPVSGVDKRSMPVAKISRR